MKKVLLSILTFFVLITTNAQTKIQAQVDQRVELLSILARLAGYEEYNHSFAKKYVADIHNYFDAYENDTIINFMQYMRSKNSLGFERVMTMAVNLDLKDRNFSLIDSWKNDLRGWKQNDAIQFVSLLNIFYKKAHFENFFKNEATYYSATIKAFDDSIISNFNQSWYSPYYGTKSQEKFNVIIACGNGGQNYGANINSSTYGKQIYSFIGSATFDTNGNPIFKKSLCLPLVVHEFNHSFINPILNKYESNDTLKNSGIVLFDAMKAEMLAENDGDWQTVINESIVRACVVRYLMANNASEQAINAEIKEQTDRGFLWTKSLVDLLGIYESNRNIYPTFQDFYPRIIYFFDTTATHIATLKSDYDNNYPRVTSIEPFANNAQDVDPNLKEMTIYFSHPMNNEHYSFYVGEFGKNGYPLNNVIGYSEDKMSIKIGINLKSDTDYEMIIGGHFQSIEGYPLKNYTIKFKTRKQ